MELKTGNLTPKANSTVKSIRFTGAFGQPNGFASILEASIQSDGRLVLTIHHKDAGFWSVELDNQQRKVLAELATCYEPKFHEVLVDKTKDQYADL